MQNPYIAAFLAFVLALSPIDAIAQKIRIGHSGLPVPRFVNLKNDETWGRMGPSFNHPVKYVFQRQHLPVRVIAETRDNVWRQIEDHEGTATWVHRSQLVSADMVIVTRPDGILLRKEPDPGADGRAMLQEGLIIRVEACERRWCRVRADDYRGWVPQNAVWGTDES